ncbi:HAD family hydrolase [Dactylosporangium sp. NPDC051484]|uniref:HAD family hydrolase n=1 Tax=Dactylosporangium sp. NPDC051484 TaxID=3154942 RepID=UPI00344F7FCE
MRSSVTVACDLDRTLIYSRSAMGSDAEAAQLHLVEMYEGRPLSFYTRNTHRLLDALRTMAEFVPATTRTVAQYRRIAWATEPAYAVTSNGGRILAGGRVDEDWSARMAGVLARECASFAEVGEHVRATANQEGIRRWHEADGMFHYTVMERAKLPSGLIDDLSGWCTERGWTVSVQGRKLYCVPKPLAKSAAVAEVHHRVGGSRLLAAGDSILDAELLAVADAAIRPAHGELHRIDWHCPDLTVTQRSGILGGEEIVAWLLATAAPTG